MTSATAPETSAARSPPPGRNRRMDLPYHEDHVPVRSRVAAIEQGACPCAGACSSCWFHATGACSGKGRISGKGSGGRTNAPQTSQAPSANMGESTAHEAVPLNNTTAGYSTPPTAQGRKQKVTSSRASLGSGASQSPWTGASNKGSWRRDA
jgi:hypothetical protein